jgi:hypothetical protein
MHYISMAQSRKISQRSAAYEKNITKRGLVNKDKNKERSPVGPWLLALFVFLVIGSAVFQVISTAQRGASPF